MEVQEYLEQNIQEDEIVDNQDIEVLMDYIRSPLNINKAEYEDFKELQLLNDKQIDDILRHRIIFGNFIAIEELQSIPSLNLSDIRRIRLFIRTNESEKLNISFKEIFRQSKHEIFLKWSGILETQEGFRKDSLGKKKYLGTPYKQFIRWKSSYENKIRLALTLEKDPGEIFNSDLKSLGHDYMSTHLHLKDQSYFLKDLIIGDFSISMGQGLITHRDFGTGKSSDIRRVKKAGRTIRAYNSIQENGFMRGIASTVRPSRRLAFTLVASRANRDGNITQDSIIDGSYSGTFSSFQNSGNHRTEAELFDRKAIGINSYAAVARYNSAKFNFSLNGMAHYFNHTKDKSSQLYSKYSFHGNQLSNISLDYNYSKRNIRIFGEHALSSTGGSANLVGALISLDRNSGISILWRNYDTDYNALEPNGFGESTGTNNEVRYFSGYRK